MTEYEYLIALDAFDEELREANMLTKGILLLLAVSPLNEDRKNEILQKLDRIARDLLMGKKKRPMRRLAGYKSYLLRIVKGG